MRGHGFSAFMKQRFEGEEGSDRGCILYDLSSNGLVQSGGLSLRSQPECHFAVDRGHNEHRSWNDGQSLKAFS